MLLFRKIQIRLLNHFAALFCLTLLSASPTALYSQATNVSKDTAATKEIKPFDISNLSEELEKTTIFLNSIEKAISPKTAELTLDSLMPETFEQISKLYQDPRVKDIEDLNLRELNVLRKNFFHFRNLLEQWRDYYKAENKQIEPLSIKLQNQYDQWNKTLSVIKEQKLPQENILQFQALLKEIKKHQEMIQKRNGQLLSKQNTLTEKIITLYETILEIDNTLKRSEGKLFTIDNPTLWAEVLHPTDTLSSKVKFNNIWNEQKMGFQKFWTYYSYQFKIHLIVTIIIIIALFYFKNEIKKWSEDRLDESLHATLSIIYHPISAGLLISLIFSGLFYPDAPFIQEHLKYLRIIPLIIILPRIVPGIRKNFLVVFVALVILLRITTLISQFPLIIRLSYLIIDIAAIITLWPLIKPKSKMKNFRSGPWWEFGLFIIKICFVAFVISIFANFIGNVSLATFLTNGGIGTIFWGVLFYVVVIVFESLLALWMLTKTAQKTAMVSKYPDILVSYSKKIIRSVFFVLWLIETSKNYLFYDQTVKWLSNTLTHAIKIGTLNISLGGILSFVFAIWIAFVVARFVRFVLQEEVLSHFDLPRGVPGAIGMITRLIIIMFGFFIAFGVAGIDLSNIAIIFGALGVGIGFGLQNIFNNLMSGLILAFERPIQVGDIIQISTLDLMGEVKEIGFRASIIRTFDGAEVVVPNGHFISNEMINWTLSDKLRRQEILVGVEYGSDLKKVLDILNKTVVNNDNVMKKPSPTIIFHGFGDSSLNFRVLFWTHFNVGLTTKSSVGIAIDEALKKEGITIPFPQTDLHVRSIDEEVKDVFAERAIKRRNLKEKGVKASGDTPNPKKEPHKPPAANEKK